VGEYFTNEAVNTGYTQVPHGLWNAPGLTYGSRCLLGWLHSHSPGYLAKLSVAKCLEQFGVSDSEGRKMLNQLVTAGYLTTVKQARGRLEVRLIAEPWLNLHRSVESRTPETGAPAVAEDATVPETGSQCIPETGTPIEDQTEKNNHENSLRSFSADPAPQKSAKPPRSECDALYQSIVTACGMKYAEMTKRQRGSLANVSAELMGVGATPDEVHRRALIYRQKFECVLTPNALANQWAGLREPDAPVARAGNGVMDRVKARLAAEKSEQPPDNVVTLRAVGQ
jgi:hypothetical protein